MNDKLTNLPKEVSPITKAMEYADSKSKKESPERVNADIAAVDLLLEHIDDLPPNEARSNFENLILDLIDGKPEDGSRVGAFVKLVKKKRKIDGKYANISVPNNRVEADEIRKHVISELKKRIALAGDDNINAVLAGMEQFDDFRKLLVASGRGDVEALNEQILKETLIALADWYYDGSLLAWDDLMGKIVGHAETFRPKLQELSSAKNSSATDPLHYLPYFSVLRDNLRKQPGKVLRSDVRHMDQRLFGDPGDEFAKRKNLIANRLPGFEEFSEKLYPLDPNVDDVPANIIDPIKLRGELKTFQKAMENLMVSLPEIRRKDPQSAPDEEFDRKLLAEIEILRRAANAWQLTERTVTTS